MTTPMSTGLARVAVWLRAAAALAVILVLTFGVPWVLVATVGNPLPTKGWGWSQPLTDEAVLGLIASLAWVFWAQLVACLVIEVTAEIAVVMGRSAEWLLRVPGTFGGQQHLARVLVQTVVAVGIGAGITTSPAVPPLGDGSVASAEPLSPSTPQTTHPPAAATPITRAATLDAHAALPTRSATVAQPPGQRDHERVEVERGDTLWSIAERHLGSGEQWRRIADLNQGRPMPDGHTFRHAASLQPGWQLLIPAGGRQASASQHQSGDAAVVVRDDDTLWGLAEQAYGDGADWPRIFHANTDQISDPDLIHPGQRLDVPEAGDSQGRTTPLPGPSAARRTPDPTRSAVPPQRATRAAPAPAGVPRPPRQQLKEANPPQPPQPEAAPDTASAVPSHRTGHGDQDDASHTSDTSSIGNHLDLAETLAGGGALLAGGALALFLAHRRRQFRHRRSGRTIAPTPTHLVPAEATLRSTGTSGGASAAFLDHALRNLSSRLAAEDAALPEVTAVRLSEDRLDLMLASPDTQQPPHPWTMLAAERWSLSRQTPLPAQDQQTPLAPYPALVAIGTDADGATWLLDLEAARVVQLVGNAPACENLARYLAAELALNEWSDDVDVTIAGLSNQLVGLNPARLRHQDDPDVSILVKHVRRVREATEATTGGVLAGRLSGRGADSWMPTILIAATGSASDQFRSDVDQLLEDLNAHPGRHATALVTTTRADEELAGATVLHLDAHRALTLKRWDVRLIANQLTAPLAARLADLLTANDTETDAPMPPAAGGRPFETVSDAAGALLVQHTGPRDEAASRGSLLPLPDEQYLTTAATTPADLAALAPVVSNEVAEHVLSLDPTLDIDLAAWSDPDTPRPRLQLLGPVELRASGERTPEVDRRCGYFTEIVAYLATRDHGATPEQVADTFHVQTNTIHSRVGTARKWLGTDPVTGDWYLPESTLSPASKRRGVPVYEVLSLLSDADLFKRLRLRGQARGPSGIDDLTTALSLVNGIPFDQHRPQGYGWLADTPLDQYLTAGIVDTAHIVATHALATGNRDLARWASQTAINAAPSEDKPRLDLAAAMSAEGNNDEADKFLTDEVQNRADDRWAPPAPSSRTNDVLTRRMQAPGHG